MKNKKLITGIVIIAIVLILGVAYAAISNITLNISGTMGATADYNVAFSTTAGDTTKTGNVTAAAVTNGTTATLTFSATNGTKNDSGTAVYKIKNTSDGLTANLSAEVAAASTNAYDPEVYDVTTSFGTTSLAAGAETTLTVTVKLKKTLATDRVAKDFKVTITAIPSNT